jgi:hypothetical protein
MGEIERKENLLYIGVGVARATVESTGGECGNGGGIEPPTSSVDGAPGVAASEVLEVEDVGQDGVLREGRGAQLPAAAPPGEGAGNAGADEDDEDDAGAEAEQREHRAR